MNNWSEIYPRSEKELFLSYNGIFKIPNQEFKYPFGNNLQQCYRDKVQWSYSILTTHQISITVLVGKHKIKTHKLLWFIIYKKKLKKLFTVAALEILEGKHQNIQIYEQTDPLVSNTHSESHILKTHLIYYTIHTKSRQWQEKEKHIILKPVPQQSYKNNLKTHNKNNRKAENRRRRRRW